MQKAGWYRMFAHAAIFDLCLWRSWILWVFSELFDGTRGFKRRWNFACADAVKPFGNSQKGIAMAG